MSISQFRMPNVFSSNNETERLAALHRYEILDTPPDGAFDHVTELVAAFFNVPIALISLVDHDRIWFKSSFGFGERQIPRDDGLCASAIFADDVYIIKNTLEDPKALANPLVAGEFGLRFYAASPLVTFDGFRLGTLNIMDFQPRAFSPTNAKQLEGFAKIVMDEMNLRLSARKTIESLKSFLKGVKHPEEFEKFVRMCAWTNKINIGDKWLSFDEFLVQELGLNITHGISPEALAKIKQEFSGK